MKTTKEKTDLDMLKDPEQWPAWPYLPVKRYTPQMECGLVWASGKAEVIEANLFHLPPTVEEFLALPKKVYSSFEELLQDGWMVD